MKIFDSCVYPENYREDGLTDLSNKLRLNVTKAILQLDSRKNINFKLIKKFCSTKKNLIAAYSYNPNISLKKNIEILDKYDFKIIKIHPRYMNLHLKENESFYRELFGFAQKKKLLIQWCSLDSWNNGQLPEISQIFFLNKILNNYRRTKLIIMHGGGSEILKYYENFRFFENVFLDLSYTLCHFENSSLISDLQFLSEKFDRRVVVGSDYPCFKFSTFKKNLNRITKNVSERKKKNILYMNLDYLTNDK